MTDYNYDSESLYERGAYLSTHIDSIPNKASAVDISELPSGNNVVAWGPSSGKTTALRQFVVNNICSSGVIATKLVDDVESLRYDIISSAYYKNPNLDIDLLKSQVISFHSSMNAPDPSVIRHSNWIICTHERLLIEPPTLIYKRDLTTVVATISIEDLYRKYLFIDEYPANVYKEFPISKLTSILLLNHIVMPGEDRDYTTIEADILRAQYINSMYVNSIMDPMTVGLLNGLPTPTSQNYVLDINRGSNSVASQMSKERISFFTNLLNKKYYEYIENSDTQNYTDSLFYSVNDLPISNKYIFDGTGDMLLRDSSLWSIVYSDNFPRSLSLTNQITRVCTDVTRNSPIDKIVEEYSESLTEIANIHPNSNILVYTWKNTTQSDDNLSSSIMSRLSESISSRIKFIHYMSGHERVTSEYSDCDVVVILGKFYVPNSVISQINRINDSKVTINDYTKSLIIQLIYRSASRLGNPISLYFSDDYSIPFISSLMEEYYYVHVDFDIENSTGLISPWLLSAKDDDIFEIPDELSKIINHDNLIDNFSDCVLITSAELRKILGLSENCNNTKIRNKLNNLRIVFESESYSGGKGKSSIYKIYKHNTQ